MAIVESILVPTDLSDRAKVAARRAIAYADALGARLRFIHTRGSAQLAMQPNSLQAKGGARSGALKHLAATQARLEAWGAALGAPQLEHLDVRYDVIEGDMVAVLVDCSRHADLIVMSSHGRDELGDFLMGTKTERLLRRARCEVLVVHGAAGG